MAIPIGLADARLAGVPTVIGLYASILPMVAYALFGPARYLIVGPDAATCLLMSATITSLGVTALNDRAPVAAAVTLVVGAGLLVAAMLRLGFIANLLSRPILAGYLTGVAVTLLVGQFSGLTGVDLVAAGLLRPVIELVHRAGEINLPTLALGLGLFAGLRVAKALRPRLPAAIVAVILAIALSAGLDLPAQGVAILGHVPQGFPAPRLPQFTGGAGEMVLGSLSVLVVTYCSGVLTSSSFGARLDKTTAPNRELVGFGVANITAGLFQGFAVTGADSRTGVNIASGGATPLSPMVAAAVIAMVVAFLTGPLGWLPNAALAAILASTAIDLIDLGAFRRLARVARIEFALAVLAAAGVIWLGVMQGILIALIATFAHLLSLALNPRDTLIGRSRQGGGLVTLHAEPDADPPPGVVIYLFQGSILFLNADGFRERALAALESCDDPHAFVLDASAMTVADASSVDVLTWLKGECAERGVVLVLAGGHGRFREVLERSGLADTIGRRQIFARLEDAVGYAEALSPD